MENFEEIPLPTKKKNQTNIFWAKKQVAMNPSKDTIHYCLIYPLCYHKSFQLCVRM